MREHRRSPRKRALQAIHVTDAMTGEVIGQVGNLSLDGMLLIANRALADNALFQFAFNLPGPARTPPPRRLDIGVHEQWSEPAAIPGQFWTGFRIIDVDPRDRVALGAWVDMPERTQA